MVQRKWIDFRSDTVTKPTPAMYKAMVSAELGDDVYGDDPTTNELERLAAEIVGKEAAMFVPSGTFGNQVSIMTHINPSDEIIVGAGAHIIQHECGAAAMLSGAMIREVDDEFGYMKPEDIRSKIRKEDIHYPKTGLICLETAHSNGLVAPPEIMRETYALAQKHGIPVHTDGARIFNAAAYLKVDVKTLTQYTDSVSFCLSKGLCSPAGSMVCGTSEFIDRARRNRKLLGGGMRQTGILAACGIVSLTEMRDRLPEDHENARYLGERLKVSIPEWDIFETNIKINMVFASNNGPDDTIMDGLAAFLRVKGILANEHEDGVIRFVTHHDVTRADCDTLVAAVKDFFTARKI